MRPRHGLYKSETQDPAWPDAAGLNPYWLSRQIRSPSSHRSSPQPCIIEQELRHPHSCLSCQPPGTTTAPYPFHQRERQRGTLPLVPARGNISRSCMNGQEILDRSPDRGAIHIRSRSFVTAVHYFSSLNERTCPSSLHLGRTGACGTEAAPGDHRSGRRRPS